MISQLTKTGSKRGSVKSRTGYCSVSSNNKNINSSIIETAKSLAELNLGGETTHGRTATKETSYRSIKSTPVTPSKCSGRSRKGIIKIPSKCIEKFNMDDLSNNNYTALETVIKDILLTRKNKEQAKKSKAKTDLRPKTSNGSHNTAERIVFDDLQQNYITKGAEIKFKKPMSAQPRSYKYYYKKDKLEEIEEAKSTFTPKSLDDLKQIYENSVKTRLDQCNKRSVIKTRMDGDIELENKKKHLNLNKKDIIKESEKTETSQQLW